MDTVAVEFTIAELRLLRVALADLLSPNLDPVGEEAEEIINLTADKVADALCMI